MFYQIGNRYINFSQVLYFENLGIRTITAILSQSNKIVFKDQECDEILRILGTISGTYSRTH